MSEEEKNAIDELKSRREYFEYQPEGCNWRLSFDEYEVHTIIDVVLNLIEKQQEKLNKEKEKNKKIEDKIKGKINNLEIFRKTLPIRATEIERFIGELKDLLEE